MSRPRLEPGTHELHMWSYTQLSQLGWTWVVLEWVLDQSHTQTLISTHPHTPTHSYYYYYYYYYH
jgi:hypothetical protein